MSGSGCLVIAKKGGPKIILTAHQPAYLPWLGLFHKIALSDVFVILDDVQFEKNSFTNRNRIKGANGDFWLTVPVSLKDHLRKKIRDIRISNDKWKKKHLNSIELSYRKSPYYEEHIPFFRECYSRHWDTIDKLNEFMLRGLLDKLGIQVRVERMSDHGFQATKSDLVMEICRAFAADTFIFGSQGKDYVRPEDFSARGIEIRFQDYIHPEYKQMHGAFIPTLSVVDLLFNAGPESRDIILKDNLQKSDL